MRVDKPLLKFEELFLLKEDQLFLARLVHSFVNNDERLTLSTGSFLPREFADLLLKGLGQALINSC